MVEGSVVVEGGKWGNHWKKDCVKKHDVLKKTIENEMMVETTPSITNESHKKHITKARISLRQQSQQGANVGTRKSTRQRAVLDLVRVGRRWDGTSHTRSATHGGGCTGGASGEATRRCGRGQEARWDGALVLHLLLYGRNEVAHWKLWMLLLSVVVQTRVPAWNSVAKYLVSVVEGVVILCVFLGSELWYTKKD